MTCVTGGGGQERAEKSLSLFLRIICFESGGSRIHTRLFEIYARVHFGCNTGGPDSFPLHAVLQSLAVALTGLNIRMYMSSFSLSADYGLEYLETSGKSTIIPEAKCIDKSVLLCWSLVLKRLENKVLYSLQRAMFWEMLGSSSPLCSS